VLNNINIIFAFIVFYLSIDLQFKSELSEEIQLNELNIIVIANTLIIVPKLNMQVYILYKHTTKRLGKKKKKQIYFVECQGKTLDKI
jgi:membrane protein CcdC involved in cytochrome C biogenesis